MSYQLRVVIEKVSNKTDKVVKRETVETFDIEKPKNIFELGLRHKLFRKKEFRINIHKLYC